MGRRQPNPGEREWYSSHNAIIEPNSSMVFQHLASISLIGQIRQFLGAKVLFVLPGREARLFTIGGGDCTE